MEALDGKLADEIIALERRLASPEVRRSRRSASALIAEDFREFGASGRVYSKAQILDGLIQETVVEISLDHMEVAQLAPDLVLLTYRGLKHFPESGSLMRSLRSSIWRRGEAEGWQVIFHQGTPLPRFDE
jgi:hypothetical protein